MKCLDCGREQIDCICGTCPCEDEVRVDAVVMDTYHKNCHDCGRFLKKDRWVSKNHKWKKHGLCADCFSNYDDPMCM